ncbi:helix-turn-helix domain-containing protein [Paenibacillus pasadenensis]|nr:helix-turn-helix domain-containing protein [Paenibacillus pasadenensis]
MNIDEAAVFIGISKRTMYDMLAKRQIPFVKFRNKYLFRPESLRRWLADQETKQMA